MRAGIKGHKGKMNKILNFTKRNLKEVLRDPIIYIFCLGFPIAMIIMVSLSMRLDLLVIVMTEKIILN